MILIRIGVIRFRDRCQNMNIGITTFHRAENYGSVLQAYALTTFLQNNGFKAEILDYYFEEDYAKYDLFRWRQYLKRPQTFLIDISSYSIHKKRKSNFERFRNRYLAISNRRAVTNSELKLYNEAYDTFICGSDQIWNLECTHGINDAYFLQFAQEDKIKIAYAPSAGSYNIDDTMAEKLKHILMSFTRVSVREESLKEKLEKICSREIEVVLDPTLLLSADDYHAIEEKEGIPQDKYIFIYILSGVRYNQTLIKRAKQLAKDTGLQIKYVVDNNNGHIKGAENCSGCGPEDFLKYIDHATYVITNSFHATVFSILFHKEFFSFPRNGSNSRIFDLLKTLRLEKRYVEEGNLNCERVDFEQVDEILKKEKQKSTKFLLDALSNE